MLYDISSVFSLGQAVTTSTVSTNILDLGAPRDIATGLGASVVLIVAQRFAGLTSVDIEVRASAAANLSSPTSLTSSGPIPLASLTPEKFLNTLSLGQQANSIGLRYIGLYYTVVGTGTAGKFTAFLTTFPETHGKIYPVGSSA